MSARALYERGKRCGQIVHRRSGFKIDGFPQPLTKSALATQPAIPFGGGVQFSSVGAEILSLIKTQPNPSFVAAVGEIMKLFGLRLLQLDPT